MLCDQCGKRPAACRGRYEDSAVPSDNSPTHACDECCAHGNEDGWCEMLPSAAQVRDKGAGPKVGSDEYYEALGDLVEQHPIGGHLRPPSPLAPQEPGTHRSETDVRLAWNRWLLTAPEIGLTTYLPFAAGWDAGAADERSRATREATGAEHRRIVARLYKVVDHYANEPDGDKDADTAFGAIGNAIDLIEREGPGGLSPPPDAGGDKP